MSDGMRRELVYLSSYATNRYFIPNWGICSKIFIYDINIEDYEEYSKMDWWSIVDALCRSVQSFESR